MLKFVFQFTHNGVIEVEEGGIERQKSLGLEANQKIGQLMTFEAAWLHGTVLHSVSVQLFH